MRVSRAQIQKLEKSGRLTISKPAAKPPPAISEQEIEKIAEAVSQKAKKDDVTGTQTFRFSNERDQDGRLTAVLANAAVTPSLKKARAADEDDLIVMSFITAFLAKNGNARITHVTR